MPEVQKGGGAVDVVQRAGLNKQLVETVGRYAKPKHIVLQLDNTLIPRRSDKFREIEQSIERVPQTTTVTSSAKAAWARSRLHGKSTCKVPEPRSR